MKAHEKKGKSSFSVSAKDINSDSIVGNKDSGWYFAGGVLQFMVLENKVITYNLETNEKTEMEFHVWDVERGVELLRQGLSGESAKSVLEKLTPKE